MNVSLRLISSSFIAIFVLCASFILPAFAIYSTDDIAAPAWQVSVPNFYSRRANDPGVRAAHIAESSGRHADAMHYYSRAALLAPYAQFGIPNAYKSFYLHKALAEGRAAQPPDQTELTNVTLRLASELWFYKPEEAVELYERAYDLIPDSSPKKESIAGYIQKAQSRMQIKSATNEQSAQKKLSRELKAAETPNRNEAQRWAQLAATEAGSGHLEDAYLHAEKAIAACHSDSKNFPTDFFCLYIHMQNCREYLNNREPERLYHLAIKQFQSTKDFDKREVLIAQALMFRHYLETKQFSKASRFLAAFTRGSGRLLNVRLFEISAFDIVENAILALGKKNSEQALKLQRTFIACEKLELPKTHQRFVVLLENLSTVEKYAGHSDAAVTAYSESVKLELDFIPLRHIKDMNSALVSENVQFPEVNLDALLANSNQPKYGDDATESFRKQLSDCEINKNSIDANKIALKLCDIIEHQDDTHAGRHVGCIVYVPEFNRIDPYISSIKASLELKKKKSAVCIIKRALQKLPDLQPYELKKLANASIDCGDRILATKLAERTEKRLHASLETISSLDLPSLWKRLNRPDKVAEFSGHAISTAMEVAEQKQKDIDGIFYQTGI